MRIRENDDSHNVYVLYSDLLFNLLILFTIFVLALVVRFNQSLREVHDQRDQITRARADLNRPDVDPAVAMAQARRERDQALAAVDAANLRASRAESDLARATQRLGEASRDASAAARNTSLQRELSIAAGANRFAGRTGGTTLCVTIDLTQRPYRYVFIPASTFDEAHSHIDGETDEQQRERSARQLRAAGREADRFSESQLTGLFRALRTRPPGGSGDEGRLSFNFSARASLAISGCLDADGNADVDLMPAALRAQIADREFLDEHEQMINNLIRDRDANRVNEPPASVPVLHFGANGNDHTTITAGGQLYTVHQFRDLVRAFGQGGIILQYDPTNGELCPDWTTRDVLTPTGYTNAVPDQAELARLRQDLTGEHR